MGKADSQEIKEGGQTDIDDMGLKYAGKYSDLGEDDWTLSIRPPQHDQDSV